MCADVIFFQVDVVYIYTVLCIKAPMFWLNMLVWSGVEHGYQGFEDLQPSKNQVLLQLEVRNRSSTNPWYLPTFLSTDLKFWRNPVETRRERYCHICRLFQIYIYIYTCLFSYFFPEKQLYLLYLSDWPYFDQQKTARLPQYGTKFPSYRPHLCCSGSNGRFLYRPRQGQDRGKTGVVF